MRPALLIAVRLSKEGFGSVDSIRTSASRSVLAMLTYSKFMIDAQETAAELNREEKA